MARSSLYGSYVRGRLVLAGIDLRTCVGDWCDAVYAILTEVPHETLTRLRDRMTTAEALIDPVKARETWGLDPDHVAMAGTLESTAPADVKPVLPDGVPPVGHNPSIQRGGFGPAGR